MCISPGFLLYGTFLGTEPFYALLGINSLERMDTPSRMFRCEKELTRISFLNM
jgi:hypothetical protein